MRPLLVSKAVASLVLALAVPIAVHAAATRGARAAAAPTAFPDSVLARVDGDPVTRRQLREAATRFGADPDSLTPEQSREVLGLLIEQRLLAQRAKRESWIWSPQESLTYEQLRDRLTVTAALDSALAAHRAERARAGLPELSRDELGVALRDSTVARWRPRWNEDLLARLYRAWQALPRATGDMTVMEQLRIAGLMPQVSEVDSGTTLVSCDVGDLIAGEVLDEWRRLNPIYRPRIEEVEPMRDLAKNALFERELRRIAARGRLDQRPDVAAGLAERREYLSIQHFVQREVYDDLPRDSLTLRRHFESKPEAWRLPGQARVFQLVVPTRAGAEQLLERIRSAADVETLVVRAGRPGRDFIRTVSLQYDSTAYALARRLGAGAVAGPDSLPDEGPGRPSGWRVLRVMEVQEPRLRTFEEAAVLVQKDWFELEAERRMRALLTRLRQGARIEYAPAATAAPRAARR